VSCFFLKSFFFFFFFFFHFFSSQNYSNVRLQTFFSPDNSIETFVKVIDSAQKTIDLSCPGFDSWSGCTPEKAPFGCTPAHLRANEQFPVFQALLNAAHRGVTIRLLSNRFDGENSSPGLITPFDFVALQPGVTAYEFRTVTFLHTKHLLVDSNLAIISSVNNDYTSFMENREAGIVINGSSLAPIFKFLTKMIDLDIQLAAPWHLQTYNASDLAIIQDPKHIPVVIPPNHPYKGAYVSQTTSIQGTIAQMTMIANPDDAFDLASSALGNATQSIEIFIYQITDDPFCNLLVQQYNAGITIKLLVSDRIYSDYDWKAATKCYTTLYNAGITVRKCNKHIYRFSHQKFFIVDGDNFFLSSGNLGETDFPSGSNVFPPPPNFRRTNRDHTINIVDSRVAQAYRTVMDADYKLGYDFVPYN
jgi:phosphatidylserine/phosphatidylglycerophosphate/cardiolipin synthase-like enzyme